MVPNVKPGCRQNYFPYPVDLFGNVTAVWWRQQGRLEMANSARQTINYKPRYSDSEAYDLLPPTLKRAMQSSVTDWSASWALRHFNKRGLKDTIAALDRADRQFMLKGWIPARGKRKALPSSFVACRVQPLRSNSMVMS